MENHSAFLGYKETVESAEFLTISIFPSMSQFYINTPYIITQCQESQVR